MYTPSKKNTGVHILFLSSTESLFHYSVNCFSPQHCLCEAFFTTSDDIFPITYVPSGNITNNAITQNETFLRRSNRLPVRVYMLLNYIWMFKFQQNYVTIVRVACLTELEFPYVQRDKDNFCSLLYLNHEERCAVCTSSYVAQIHIHILSKSHRYLFWQFGYYHAMRCVCISQIALA
jgi:hypothetical protein